MTLHERVRDHPYTDTCFGCKVGTLQVSPGEPTQQTQAEAQWDVDIPAYKRLRAQGYQPPRTAGCAYLEANATTEYEIARGRAYQDKKHLDAAIGFVEDVFARPVTEPVIDPTPVVVG
jgi:hypothetical protein